MNFIKPKKSLGQHFLTDKNIAKKIIESLKPKTKNVLEIGPGTGILTSYLIKKNYNCLLYTSPSPRDLAQSRMPSSA